MFDSGRRRFADADSQPPEIRPDLSNEIANPVVACRTAALLQLHHARREVQLVMRDENLFDRHLVEGRDTARRAATAVHIRHRLEQPDLVLTHAYAGEMALMLRLVAERSAMPPRELIHEPEPSVMPSTQILGIWVSKSNDEFERDAR